MRKIAVAVCLCFLVSGLAAKDLVAAQKCRDEVSAATPDSSFRVYNNGTAYQNTTGLMWMRCALGQSFQNGQCRGEATKLNWQDALQSSIQHEFAGHSDWRLPNKNELDAIVEQRCVTPSINQTVFPATPSLFFWTSSPYVGVATGAWSVDFGFGVVTATEKTGLILVRLVRDVE